MKLLISVVNTGDAHPLIDALIDRGYRATLISTTGGFLREGKVTLLIGVADPDVSDVLGIVQTTCRTRTAYLSPLPPTPGSAGVYAATPIEVQVGGAVVFVLPVARYERF